MAGTYSVTVTENGCTSLAGTTPISVTPTPATPTPSSNSPVCEGQTISLTHPTVGGANYSWTGPNSFTSNIQNPTVTNAAPANAGTYNLTITVGGCNSAPGSTAVTVNPPAIVDAGPNKTACNTSAVALGGSFGGAASSVTWSTSGTGTFSNINSPTSNYTPSAADVTAGTLTLTLTTNDPSGPCGPVSDVMTLTISSIPSANFSYSPATYCQSAADPSPVFAAGASAGVFSSAAGLSINASSGAVDVSASTPGTYTVNNNIAASGSCPSASASSPITIVATPATPTASSNTPICTGNPINLATPTVASATYAWSGPASFTSTSQNPVIASAAVTNAGAYSVIVTVNGCASAAGTTNVFVNPTPATPSISSNSPICSGTTLNLTTTSTGVTYLWTGPAITAANQANQNPTIPSAVTTYSGTYTLVVTASGCSSTAASTSVTVNPAATVSAGPNKTSCNGSAVTLGGSFGGGASSITWTTSGTGTFNNANSATAIYTPSAADVTAGTVTLTITTDDPTGPCGSAAATMTITLSSAPSASSPTHLQLIARVHRTRRRSSDQVHLRVLSLQLQDCR